MERTLNRMLLAALAIVATAAGQNVTIRTIAGGYVGDGGLASQAGLYDVHSIAFDPDGTMYIADATNNRIRRMTPDGRITTVAGNGESGFKGDGGPGTLATFWQPQAVAVDSKGRLYVGDVLNRRVRRIAADGTMSTFAGDGTFRWGYDNIATSVAAGYPKNLYVDKNDVVYVIDADDHRVFKVDTATNILQLVIGTRNAVSSGDNGPAVSASTNRPYDLAVDSQGIVYVVEADGNRIRKIDKNGIVTTICGDGVSGYMVRGCTRAG